MSQTQKLSKIHNVYAYQKCRWVLIGYRCILCDRVLKSEVTLHNHIDNCKLINKNKEITDMPVQRVMQNGEYFYRWGQHGKLYKNRSDAEKQAQAAYASGYKEPKKMDNKDK